MPQSSKPNATTSKQPSTPSVARAGKDAICASAIGVLGVTLASHRLEGERLSKVKALAVFSSDALSSVAYATQEILFVLVLAGPAAIKYSLPIAGCIALLLAIVIASYRQTVRAYPSGGGAYIVAHENLGVGAGLIAASALLIDYVLTVSVSVAAGMDALASLNAEFRPFAVPLAIGIVLLVALINLRGVSESGTIFSIPTYAFVVTLSVAILVVLIKILAGGGNPLSAGTPDPNALNGNFESLGLLLLLKAFANGCTALTGVEAISNGVQAFKQPAAKNASRTLLAMGLILGTMFIGMTIVARYYAFIPAEDNTIPAQLGAHAFGDGTVLFSFLQIMTAAILVLAANTSFADFPRLSAILARDGYMPRVFHTRGNRLVFSYGIIVLASLSAILLLVFDAKTTRLIPLYALGVFLSFTLSQSGMVRHWLRDKEPGWKRAAFVNGLGAVATAIVFVVIMEAKFTQGAWVVVILIPILAGACWLIGRFYKALKRSLNVAPDAILDLVPRGESRVPIIVPVEDINLATVMALGACLRPLPRCHSRSRQHRSRRTIGNSGALGPPVPNLPLVVIDSPYRTAADPIAAYIDDRLRSAPHEVIVMIPVVEVRHGFQRLLVNQSLKRLTALLAARRQVQVVEHPFSTGSARRRPLRRDVV